MCVLMRVNKDAVLWQSNVWVNSILQRKRMLAASVNEEEVYNAKSPSRRGLSAYKVGGDILSQELPKYHLR